MVNLPIWFMFAATLAGNLAVWRMPKHLTVREMYASFVMLAWINLATDCFLSQTIPLYYMGETPLMEWYSFIVESLMGPSFGLIYLNFLPQNEYRIPIYLSTWVTASVVFEAICVSIGYLVYTGWKLWYSIFAYIIIFFCLRWHLNFLRDSSIRR